MQIGLAEFLKKVSKLKKNEEKIQALKYNDSKALRVVLQGMFDNNVKWLLPKGDVPYTPNDLLDLQHVLINECVKDKLLYYIASIPNAPDGFYPGLAQSKREMMFIETLEKLDKEDAKLLIAMKDKKCPYKGLTVDHVKAAMPDLLGEPVTATSEPEVTTETNEVETEDE